MAGKIEQAEALDRVASVIERTVGPLVSNPPARYVLGGKWLGHAVHPLLVTVPIGSWTSALVLDVTRKEAGAARLLTGFGVLSALPSALTGVSDWTQTSGPARRVGVAHAVSNWVAIALFAGSFVARGRSRAAGTALAMAGSTALSVGGYLGGHLTYVEGVGVDTAAVGEQPTI
jgi:uncharacterized membrane protein